MTHSYLIIILLLVLIVLTIDFKISHTLKKYPLKLLLCISFVYVVLLMRIYIGIKMGLWGYGNGILQIYFYDIPVEEYIFMGFAPYATIVFWEAFHKLVK